MMKVHALFFLIAVLYATTCFSQKRSLPAEQGFYLRTNPLSFLEIDGGMMIGARYQWHKNFSATLDPTFIFFNPYHEPMNDASNPLGIKIRADVRYHFKKSSPRTIAYFVAPEFHYKYRTKDRHATFGFNCVRGNCAYFMEAIYTEVKTEVGGSLKTGFDVAMSNNERLALEVYGGLGLKIFRYKEVSVPPGGSFFSEPSHQDFFGTSEGAATPILFGSLKLSYRLW
jgi:hypothetical protein